MLKCCGDEKRLLWAGKGWEIREKLRREKRNVSGDRLLSEWLEGPKKRSPARLR